MQWVEGQIYEGNASISGESGPFHRWILVAPFGKRHAQSIDNPLDLHYLPVASFSNAVESGRLRLVGHERNHPALQWQRAKERAGVRDAHLGLHGAQLQTMLRLLREAVEQGECYAEFAAGEVLASVNEAFYDAESVKAIEQHVFELVGQGAGSGEAAGT